MNRDDFIQAKLFAFTDIERELQLARTDSSKLQELGIHQGGGNFLAALGLLCYTEFAGKLKFNCRHPDGRDKSSENFNKFFDLLGPEYRSFRQMHNVYDIFRCGLAHEYYTKHGCIIAMFSTGTNCGIGVDSAGKYIFIVELYARDLRKAFEDLQLVLYGS